MAVSPSPRDVSGLYNIEIARLHPLPLRRPRGVRCKSKKCDFCFCEGAFKRVAFTPFQIAESFRQIEGACKKRGFCARDLIIEKGSRKSQRSEIFGKRSTGSAHASFALYGKARVLPTAPTKKRGFACAKDYLSARVHPFSGKSQVCDKLSALTEKRRFRTRNLIMERELSFCVTLS